jgi:DNA-binding IclR family transcriptional regulator
MKIVEYLAVDVFRPSTVTEICNALDITYDKTLWALHNLSVRGWAERVAHGWRLSPRIVKIAYLARTNLEDTVKKYFE